MRASLGFADSWMHAHPQDEQSGKAKRDSGKRKQNQHSLACGARLQPAATKRTVFQRALALECRDWCARAGGDDEWASATVFRFVWSLTFELRRDQQQDARPAWWKMREPTARAWRFDVGPRLERGVRPHAAR